MSTPVLISSNIKIFGGEDKPKVFYRYGTNPEDDDLSKEDELLRMVAENQIDEVNRFLSTMSTNKVKGVVGSRLCRDDKLIHRAVRCGLVKMTDMLLRSGICLVNEIKRDGPTPLYIAAQEGHVDLIRLLLFHGADVNILCKDGYSPLYIASYVGQLEIVNLLLDNDADPNIFCIDHMSPIYMAAQEGHADIANVLALNGANVNSATSYGVAPLLVASRKGRTATVAVLLRFGADVTASTSYGIRSVHFAARYGNIKVLKLLCAYGADLKVSTVDNVTPLMLARDYEKGEVVNWISTALHWKTPLFACVAANIHCAAKELFESGKAGAYFQDADSAIELRKFCSTRMNVQPFFCHVNHTKEKDIATLIKRATTPWCISNSSLYGPQMRELTILVLLIKNRVRTSESNFILPQEMWHHILSFTTRKQLCKSLC